MRENASKKMKDRESRTGEKKSLTRLIDVLRLAWPYRGTLTKAMIALLFAGAINLSIPELLRRLLNSASFDILMDYPLTIGAALTGIFAIQGIAFFLRSYWFGVVGHAVVFDLREQLYRSLLRKPLSFFDEQRTGDLISRINADTNMVQDVVSTRISVCIRYIVQVVFGIAFMATLSLYLTGVIVILLPLLVILARVLGKKLRHLTKEQQSALGEATTSAEESLSGIRTVKAFTGEPLEVERFVSKISSVKELGFQRSRFAAFFASAVNFLMNVSLVIVLLVGLHSVSLERLTVGDLTAFLLYGLIVAISFAFLASSIGELYQASGAAERIFETIREEEEHSLDEENHERKRAIGGDGVTRVQFREVSFRYPRRHDEQALAHVSFEVQRGEHLALVGPSGSGKSTIMNLFLRFYEPTEGEVLFNTEPIGQLPLYGVRAHIGLVPQDPLLFADTIGANLRYGAVEASEEQLREVCDQAAILEFIDSLPEGFETYVGERGVQLSGGQKQRLAIARALLTQPDILLLDEATSSLDSESESLIQRALYQVREQCIVISIAHRLSTVQNADKILVLHRGSIVEEGTHQELIQAGGTYHDLVSYQRLME
ncbi:ABC transporter ATP-binding protein/permease [bacterium]|nr:ABC transporter ATP-binding protein/permease [bacterium]